MKKRIYEASLKNLFTEDEISELWNELQNEEFIGVILIQIYGGCRAQELYELRKESINLEERKYTVYSRKNGEFREIPIVETIVPVFEYWINRSNGETLLEDKNGRSYNNLTYRLQFREIMRKLNMRHNITDMRHTFLIKYAHSNYEDFVRMIVW